MVKKGTFSKGDGGTGQGYGEKREAEALRRKLGRRTEKKRKGEASIVLKYLADRARDGKRNDTVESRQGTRKKGLPQTERNQGEVS